MRGDSIKFMKEAILEAKKAYKKEEVPVGAVIVRDGEIIGRGHNLVITLSDPTSHAEIVAIRNCARHLKNYRLTDCEIYVTVEPCIMCLGAIIQARIKKIYFGTPDPRYGAIISLLNFGENQIFNHHFKFEGNILEKDCKSLIQDFFKKKRNS